MAGLRRSVGRKNFSASAGIATFANMPGACAATRIKAIMMQSEKYEYRRQNGLCYWCGDPVHPGYKRCLPCHEKGKSRNNARRKTHIANGVCIDCEKNPATNTQRCKECNTKILRALMELRCEVIYGYGGECVCCGESHFDFLTIDHVVNVGHESLDDKKDYSHKTGTLFRRLKKLGFPKGYRCLCFNCNSGREVNGGICEHDEERAKRGEKPKLSPLD